MDKKDKPLISVLMGIYNCADTLEEAVRCIIEQTYENWELIMCDDCSTDNTYAVAQKLADGESRIILLKNEVNLTLAPTLNKCLESASGKYIARMDGDDLCDRHRFQKEIEFLEKSPEFALVSCHMNLFDAEGVYRVVHHIETPAKKDFLKKSQFCHAGCMMRTDVMKELQGYCTERSRNRVEDYDLWVRMYEAGYKGYNLQEPLYSMRDDRHAQKRRNWLNRSNESKLKWRICRMFKLPYYCYLYAVIPIIKWLMPNFVYGVVHKR